MAHRRDEARVVLDLHLCAHLDTLIRHVGVSLRDGGALSEWAVLELLVLLIPRVLELGRDVARLARDHGQPRLVGHKVEPRGIRAGLTLEDDQPDEHAEILVVPEARRQLGVPCHFTVVGQLARLDRCAHLTERHEPLQAI
eukprot:2196273-Prymnesium_polylepis.1